VDWPNGSGVLLASSKLEAAMSAYVKELNHRAEQPLREDSLQEALDPDAPESYISSLGTVAHVAARFGMRLEGKNKWVRGVRLKHPMEIWVAGPTQRVFTAFRVILHWNPEEGSAGWAELILRAGGPTPTLLIWHASAGYKSEAAAARHLNEALIYFYQAIEDEHEPHQYQRLKEVLQMSVGILMHGNQYEDSD
jgi:hypothetical protein